MSQKNANTLRVSCRSGSFRRAGYRFGAEPQDLPLAALSEEERTAIVNEPMLDVVEVEADIAVTADSKPALAEDAPRKKAAAKAKG